MAKPKEETKKLDEIKPQEEYFLTDSATVMAVIGIPESELNGEIVISRKFGEFRKISKDLLKMNFIGEDRVIFPSGTKISKELFEKARKMAKAWGCETDSSFIEFYEAFENGAFRKDYPVVVVIDGKIPFLIAPIVDSGD